MPNKVNFEFYNQDAEMALTILLKITEPNTLIIYGVTKEDNFQFKGKAITTARADQWYVYCQLTDQDCVALSHDGKQGIMVGPQADKWTFNSEYFV